MAATVAPIVPILSFDELSPAFQERSRRGRERLGVNVNSLHAFAHFEALGGAPGDYFEAEARLTILSNELRLLIRLAIATAKQCRYCTAHQRISSWGLAFQKQRSRRFGKPTTMR